jgi:flagellar motor component MotA
MPLPEQNGGTDVSEDELHHKEELRRKLLELRRELGEVGDVDPELEGLLADILADIEVVMERAAPHPLRERLAEAIEHFEATHPRLASAMGAVADQLAAMGV